MNIHVNNRRQVIIDALTKELVGPAPAGAEKSIDKTISFESKEEAYKIYCQAVTKDEILQRVRPTQKYGVGVLYPDESNESILISKTEEQISLPQEATKADDLAVSPTFIKDLESISNTSGKNSFEKDSDDFDLSGINSYRPNCIGLSFLVELLPGDILQVALNGGRYMPVKVLVNEKPYATWWKRQKVKQVYRFPFQKTIVGTRRTKHRIPEIKDDSLNVEGLILSAEAYIRAYDESKNLYLITVCIVNRTKAKSTDENSLFQAKFDVSVFRDESLISAIVPYPKNRATDPDSEELSLQMLYRKSETYAVGHGCAADWDKFSGSRVESISASPLPIVELPSITSDVKLKDGTLVKVSLKALAGLDQNDDGSASINLMLKAYGDWIEREEKKIQTLPKELQTVAVEHLRSCKTALSRMKKGLEFLRNSEEAALAFKIANHAMLLQQIKSETKIRTAKIDRMNLSFNPVNSKALPEAYKGDRGYWRAFQIAFILMSLESSINPESSDRDTVELIWFPTGGGKTEAYLGLSAFVAAYRRIKNQEDSGVNILMRYTLRLLTAQQFQRASGLICSLEFLRKTSYSSVLGINQFSIGLWVGADVTPNKNRNALERLKDLHKNNKSANPFLVDRCPWCKGQMGPISGSTSSEKVIGYYKESSTVAFKCADPTCEFHTGLPIYVIDEEIYRVKPTMMIGTVDKFASLAFNQFARSIFGIGLDGQRELAPPSLIIQDELHLISGPLGSMVGLYEALIEEMCTVRNNGKTIKPKIVSSTATIRQYKKQIKSLYNRDDVMLFPPPGVDIEDSFFSCYARDENDVLRPGKIYVGVFGPGLSSMQTTQVRTFSALLQAPVELSAQERDPWWTLLIFFNSLRELGTTLSLLQSDIPGYLRTMAKRLNIDSDKRRWLNKIKELTSRLRNDEIPQAMNDLEVDTTKSSGYPVDVCLASNIIEVGIDIDRLSMMTVVGQPKTTSQYIQVTGRVGRKWWERPGLVITLYGVSKPRDRSHFEKFRSYHERLYAHVEPTSSTPFSAPVLDRALHGLIVSYVRQFGNTSEIFRPKPMPFELIAQIREILMKRVENVDPEEKENFRKVFDKRIDEWQRRKRDAWETNNPEEYPLIYRAGNYIKDTMRKYVWAVPQSLRNVDADCEAYITQLYNETESENIGESIDV